MGILVLGVVVEIPRRLRGLNCSGRLGVWGLEVVGEISWRFRKLNGRGMGVWGLGVACQIHLR